MFSKQTVYTNHDCTYTHCGLPGCKFSNACEINHISFLHCSVLLVQSLQSISILRLISLALQIFRAPHITPTLTANLLFRLLLCWDSSFSYPRQVATALVFSHSRDISASCRASDQMQQAPHSCPEAQAHRTLTWVAPVHVPGLQALDLCTEGTSRLPQRWSEASVTGQRRWDF